MEHPDSRPMPLEEPKEAVCKRWFVLRDLKRPNAKEPAYLMLRDKVETVFTPMTKQVVTRKGRKQVVEVPYMRDLVFVHDSPSVIDPIVEVTPTLQYRFVRGVQSNERMVVPDDEMERFMALVNSQRMFQYYTPDEVSATMCGRDIIIVGGELDGIRGKLLTVRGSKRKQLVVALRGLLAVGVVVEPEYIQFAD